MKPHLLFIALVFALFVTPAAHALDLSADGYYRIRFVYSHDLDLQTPNPGIVPGDLNSDTNDRFGSIMYGQQRFRINPNFKLNDHISIHGQMDFLDNVLFGQSDVNTFAVSNPIAGTINPPIANSPNGIIGGSSGDVLGGGGNINVRRLWVDILTSAGQFRIGRQPSQFGLGILANDGDGIDADFGDTYDRLLYLAGIELPNHDRLNFGLAYDFAYEGQHDPSLFGLADGEPSNWNDVYQGGMILLYQANAFEIGLFGGVRYRNGQEGAYTTTAAYIDNCADDGRPASTVCLDANDPSDPAYDQDHDGRIDDSIILPAGKDGNTFIYLADLYAKFRFNQNYSLGLEGVYIGGKISTGIAVDAIALDAPSQAGFSNPLTAPISLPLTGDQNKASVIMAASEFDANWDFGGEVHVQSGYASGDGHPESETITQLGFRPDYDIALILFNQPLGTSPAIVIGGVTELGRVPMTGNYVNNAIYWTTEYKQEFNIKKAVPWADDFKVGIKGITAYAPQNNLDLNFAEITDGIDTLPYLVNRSHWYGFEVDSSVEATFFDVMKWKTVVGVFVPGALYDIKNDNGAIDATGFIDTILPDKANIAMEGRTNLVFEF